MKNRENLSEENIAIINKVILHLLIPYFLTKNKGFEEEQEVRIVNIALPRPYDNRDIYFHGPNKSHIKLFDDNQDVIKNAVKEIIIGPMPHQELAKQQVESMLEQYGFNVNRNNQNHGSLVSVKCSKIPFIKR